MKNIFLVFIQDLKRICMRGLTLCQTGTHTEQTPLPASRLLWRLMIRV